MIEQSRQVRIIPVIIDDEARIDRLQVPAKGHLDRIGMTSDTLIEKLLEEISFNASDKPGSEYVVTATMVRETVGELAKDADLSKFIL